MFSLVLEKSASLKGKKKEQLAATLKYLARELSDAGGPLLSDTIDAYHVACYQALDAERNSLSECTRKQECAFTAVEMWQQAVEMVLQSGAANRDYTALVDEDWQYQQYQELFKKRAHKALTMDLEPGSLIGTNSESVKRWLTGAAQRLQEMKNLERKTGSTSLAEKAEGIEGKSLIHDDVWRQWEKECLDAMNEEIDVKSLFSQLEVKRRF